MLADDYRTQLGITLQNLKSNTEFRANIQAAWDAGSISAFIDAEAERYATSASMQRFVLSPQIVEAASDLARSSRAVEATRDFIYTPAVQTWIEWAGGSHGSTTSNRHAVLLDGMGIPTEHRLTIGAGSYVYDADRTRFFIEHYPFFYDFPGPGKMFRDIPSHMNRDKAAKAKIKNPRASKGIDTAVHEAERSLEEVDFDQLSRFITAALCMMNTPRVSHVIPHDLTVLNKSRFKRNQPALLSYSDVNINPDSGWRSRRETRQLARTGQMPRHHVRTFLRLKRGRVELVGAHWRGNAENGYKLHRHVISMAGEEAGRWKGGPLPAPHIMRPGETVDEGQ